MVLEDVAPELVHLLACLHLLELNHANIDLSREHALRIVYISYSATHAGGKVAACVTKNDYTSTSHVLAAMITNTLVHRDGTRVAYSKAFSTFATEEGLTRASAVESHVADNDVVLGHETLVEALFLGIDSNFAATQALASTIVRVAGQVEENSFC